MRWETVYIVTIGLLWSRGLANRFAYDIVTIGCGWLRRVCLSQRNYLLAASSFSLVASVDAPPAALGLLLISSKTNPQHLYPWNICLG